MNNTILMTGIGGLIVGFVLGNIAGRNSGPDPMEAMSALDGRMATLTERIDGIEGGLSDRLAAIETGVTARFDAVDSAVAAQVEAMAQGTESLRGDLAALGTSVGDAVSGAAESAAAAVAAMAQPAADAQPAPEEAAEEPEAEQPAEPAASAPAPGSDASAADSSTGARPGMTVALADGAIRAFISRVADGRVTMAVNGLDMQTLSAGRATEVTGAGGEACLLSVTAADGGADLAATCGDARPEPAGHSAGETAILSGNVRVFVSSATGGAARVAIDGQDLVSAAAGEAITLEDRRCAVVVEGIDRGHVDLSSTCN